MSYLTNYSLIRQLGLTYRERIFGLVGRVSFFFFDNYVLELLEEKCENPVELSLDVR